MNLDFKEIINKLLMQRNYSAFIHYGQPSLAYFHTIIKIVVFKYEYQIMKV